MKIVIEIDDDLYNEILSRKYSKTRLEKAVAKGTPLPENVTNRDVIKNIFGKYFSIPLATTDEWLGAPYERSDTSWK